MRKRTLLGIGLLTLLGALVACRQETPSPASPEVVLRLVDPYGNPGLGWVAYQVGDGPWRTLLPQSPGEYRFSLPEGETRYGVAAACPHIGPIAPAWSPTRFFVFQLTAGDTLAPVIPCGNGTGVEFGALKLTVDASAVGANKVVALSRSTGSEAASGREFDVAAPVGERRFVVLAYDGDREPEKLRGVRIFSARVPGSLRLTLGPEDAVNLGTGHRAGRVEAFTVPAGYDPSYGVGYYGSRGPVMASPPDFPIGLNALGTGAFHAGPYALVNGGEAGESYVFQVWGSKPDFSRRVGTIAFRPPATEVFRPGPLPDPWPDAYAVAPSRRPRFALDRDDGPAGYRILLLSGSGNIPTQALEVYLSRAWLEGRNTYLTPDLSGAEGFAGSRPESGERVLWEVDAVYTDVPLGRWLESPDWLVWVVPIFAMPAGTQPVLGGADWRVSAARGRFAAP